MEASSSSNSDQTLGLLCHYLFSNGSAQYVFLDLDNEQPANSIRFAGFCAESNCHICASSNGMILFSSVKENVHYYHIFDPLTRQSVFLPPPQNPNRSIRTGLAFDGMHYQVVRVFTIEGEAHITEMEIFSSQTGEWRQYYSIIHLPPELPIMSTNPLFWNGAIYWELGGHLLIYYVNLCKCMLIKLPNYSKDQHLTFGQCFWASRGHLHYCYSDFQGIHIWSLVIQRGHDSGSLIQNLGSVDLRWELSYRIMNDELMTLNPGIFLSIRQREEFSCWKPSFVSPLAYVEHLDSLYLRLPGFIVQYDFRTRTLKELCTYAFPHTSFNCCAVFPVLTNSSTGNYKASSGNGGILCLPLVATIVNRCGSQ